jgi:hypothetical protein
MCYMVDTLNAFLVFMALIGLPLICAAVILILAYLRKLGIYRGE